MRRIFQGFGKHIKEFSLSLILLNDGRPNSFKTMRFEKKWCTCPVTYLMSLCLISKCIYLQQAQKQSVVIHSSSLSIHVPLLQSFIASLTYTRSHSITHLPFPFSCPSFFFSSLLLQIRTRCWILFFQRWYSIMPKCEFH